MAGGLPAQEGGDGMWLGACPRKRRWDVAGGLPKEEEGEGCGWGPARERERGGMWLEGLPEKEGEQEGWGVGPALQEVSVNFIAAACFFSREGRKRKGGRRIVCGVLGPWNGCCLVDTVVRG